MASITIRNLDDSVKTRLRILAAGHGRSMEEEARLILAGAVEQDLSPEKGLAQVYHPFKNSVSYHTVMMDKIGVWHYKCRPDAGLHERLLDTSG